MVAIQEFARLRHIGAVFIILVPGKLQTHIEVIAQYTALGAAVGLLSHTLRFLQKLFFNFLRQMQRQNLFLIFRRLCIGIAFSQFLLQYLQLFAQYVIFLHAPQAFTHFALQLLLDGKNLQLPR